MDSHKIRTASRVLTAQAIAGMKPGTMRADDAIPPGAGRLKVRKRANTNGVATEFIFLWHRADGARASMVIGKFTANSADGLLTLAEARNKARALQGKVRAGEDPAHDAEIEKAEKRREQRAAVARVRETEERTLSKLLGAYVAHLEAAKKSSARDVRNIFDNHVTVAFPDIAAMPAGEVTPQHVARILARLVGPDVQEKKGRTAVKLRSYMGAAFRLAMGASVDPMQAAGAAGFDIASNPVATVPVRAMAELFNRAGHRTLTPDELRTYLFHVDALDTPMMQAALRLQLVAGGQRMQQLLRLRWADVSDANWTLHDGKGKRSTPRRHVLPQVPEMAEVLAEIRKFTGDREHVFASRGGLLSHENASATVREISDVMGGPPFRGGDIRRTAETLLASALRISKDDRAQLLSHGIAGVQDVNYDKGAHIDAKTEALRKWNDYIADLCIGSEQ